MTLNDTLNQILPTLLQDEQQDVKSLVMDTTLAEQVRDELNKVMNARLLVLEPGVTYPWSPKPSSGTGAAAGTAAPAAQPKKHA